MKSLRESLFDDDLVGKSSDRELLYGLVKRASVFTSQHIDYLDKSTIKRDYSKIIKTCPEQDWNINGNWWTSMKRVQNTDSGEMLRELLYVIVGGIKTSDIIDGKGVVVKWKLENKLKERTLEYCGKSTIVDVLIFEPGQQRRFRDLEKDDIVVTILFAENTDDNGYNTRGNISFAIKSNINS